MAGGVKVCVLGGVAGVCVCVFVNGLAGIPWACRQGVSVTQAFRSWRRLASEAEWDERVAIPGGSQWMLAGRTSG